MNNCQKLYERAIKSIPGGVQSGSRARQPYPKYFKKGEGPYIYDVDNNRYIDLVLGNGAIFFGHGHEEFLKKFNENLKECEGLTTGYETELAVKAAELFKQIVPADRVRFTNTGTEAIIHVMQMARAYTGKNDFALVEGCYNGWVDNVNISTFPDIKDVGDINRPNAVPGAGGIDKRALESVVIVPFNNLEVTRRLLSENKDRIAGLILEPVMIDIGFVEPRIEYLKELRKMCDELGILLIFDELLTGFRVPEGSCQKWFNVPPDLSIFGKAIANGHILAAVAGKYDVMETIASKGTASFVGTFNGHVYSMAAAVATLELMLDGSEREKLERKTRYMKEKFEESAKKYGIKAVLNGRGGHFHWYFTDNVQDYRDAANSNKENYLIFANAMLEQNINVIPKPLSHHAISVSHNDEIIEEIVVAMDKALKVVAEKNNK
jgi:glutamate-1-semialdehyde 2,1-aminomutase